MFKRNKIYRYQADKNSGGEGGETATSPVNDGSGTSTVEDTETAEENNAKFTQEDVDRIVNERLNRAKKQAEEREQKAKEEAEAKALEEQQKFQELAEKRAAKIKELESQIDGTSDKADRYETALTKLLEQQRSNVPEHLHSLLDKLDPVEQLEWIASNADSLKSSTGSVPSTPKPSNSGKSAEEKEAARKAQANFTRSVF